MDKIVRDIKNYDDILYLRINIDLTFGFKFFFELAGIEEIMSRKAGIPVSSSRWWISFSPASDHLFKEKILRVEVNQNMNMCLFIK
jgi:hypothetical protein